MKTIPVKFDRPATTDEALKRQSFYYMHAEHPIDTHVLAEKLNDYFRGTEGWDVDCFSPGKPRVGGELAITIKWPRWRAERKPIKTKLQAGILIPY